MLVQKLRLQHGWSQQQLAALSGLSVRTIQRIENGQGASTESLKSLAAVFETDFATLQGQPDMNESLKPGTTIDEALALHQVQRIKAFYLHVIRYVFVMLVLAVINIVASPHKLWVIWPALGWGAGLLSHAMRTFDVLPFFGAEWEKREVERRLGRSL